MRRKQSTRELTHVSYLSLAIEELRDIDLGDISKSESDRYKKDSRLCGKFCNTKPPEDGDVPPVSNEAPAAVPSFSTSNLQPTNT